MPGQFDPILLEVLWNRLLSLVNEQARALIRASFTTILRENEDLSCGVFDAQGQMIAQSTTGTPGHINSLATGVENFLKRYPAHTLKQGDILITNDPWLVSGHKHDISVLMPLFSRKKLVGFNGSTCHVLDIGGKVLSAEAAEVYEEGLEIPIMKLYKEGVPNDDLFELIAANVRAADLVLGDIRAQVAASEASGQKLVRFLEEYGLTDLEELSRVILTTSERAMRKETEPLPDGTYRHQIFLDGFDEPVKIAVAITIADTDIIIDYTGTSPQSKRGINVVKNYTHAYTTYAIKASICPEVPNNHGSFRPVKLVVPEGCILNATFPAPVAARHMTGHFCSPAVWGALAKVVPEKVLAESSANCLTQFDGIDAQGRSFVASFFTNGGMGARPNKDGLCTSACPTNVGNTPVEVIENVYPFFITKRELLPDSGGPGKFRGGLAQTFTLKLNSDRACTLSCLFERVKFPARGYQAGKDGSPAEIVIKRANGELFRPHGKMRVIVYPEDEIEVKLAGGGGYGDPSQRDPELVLEDVMSEVVSMESARRDYKVDVDLQKRSVNWEETQRLRQG